MGSVKDLAEKIVRNPNGYNEASVKVAQAYLDLACRPPEPVYLAITMEGGLIQSIHTNYPNAFSFVEDLIVIDFDTEGSSEKLIEIPELPPVSKYGPSEAVVHRDWFETSAIDLPKLSEMLDTVDEEETESLTADQLAAHDFECGTDKETSA